MDATQSPSQPQHGDEPMSVDVLRNLMYDQGALSIDELCLLLGGLSRSGGHRYLESTELRFGQLLVIFRHAKSDRVRQAILAELLPASGWHVTQLPADLDMDGDGDVDTDDALRSIIETIERASGALKVMLHNGETDGRYINARRAVADVADRAVAALAIIDHLTAHAPKRRKLNGRGVTNAR